jgi:uncharacterized protein (UPF0264 family)
MSPEAIGRAAARTRGAGLIAALAGRLTAADLPIVRDTGADIAGVRGAACDEGRTGHISAVRIALLARLLGHERGGYVVSRAGFTLLPI